MTGGFASFERLRKQLSQKSLADAKSKLLKNLGEQAVTLVRAGFRDSKAPDGTPWAPLKRREGKPLLRTGRLRGSVSWMLTPNGFRLTDNVVYGVYQQFGTNGHKTDSTRHAAVDASGKFMSKRKAGQKTAAGSAIVFVGIKTLNFKQGMGGIPARPFVPDASKLPAAWEQAFERVSDRLLKKLTT